MLWLMAGGLPDMAGFGSIVVRHYLDLGLNQSDSVVVVLARL